MTHPLPEPCPTCRTPRTVESWTHLLADPHPPGQPSPMTDRELIASLGWRPCYLGICQRWYYPVPNPDGSGQ